MKKILTLAIILSALTGCGDSAPKLPFGEPLPVKNDLTEMDYLQALSDEYGAESYSLVMSADCSSEKGWFVISTNQYSDRVKKVAISKMDLNSQGIEEESKDSEKEYSEGMDEEMSSESSMAFSYDSLSMKEREYIISHERVIFRAIRDSKRMSRLYRELEMDDQGIYRDEFNNSYIDECQGSME